MAPFNQSADQFDSSTYADTLAAGAPARPLTPELAETAAQTPPIDQASRGHCLVVVPTYNEALNIERLVIEILGQGPQFKVVYRHHMTGPHV